MVSLLRTPPKVRSVSRETPVVQLGFFVDRRQLLRSLVDDRNGGARSCAQDYPHCYPQGYPLPGLGRWVVALPSLASSTAIGATYCPIIITGSPDSLSPPGYLAACLVLPTQTTTGGSGPKLGPVLVCTVSHSPNVDMDFLGNQTGERSTPGTGSEGAANGPSLTLRDAWLNAGGGISSAPHPVPANHLLTISFIVRYDIVATPSAGPLVQLLLPTQRSGAPLQT